MEQRIKRVMASIFNIDEAQISDDANPDTIENWDSLNHVKLILGFEQEFGIKIVGAEVIEMVTIETIKEIISQKLEQANAV